MTGTPRATFIIAEAGVNHNGDLGRALEMVKVAADAGADAVKFQSFITEKEVTRSAPLAKYQRRNTGADGGQFEMLKKLELSRADHRALMRACDTAGIEFMSTPFDPDSADFLIRAKAVKRLKVASGEITNGPLLLQLARSKKPIVLSTGMSTLDDVLQALWIIAFGYVAKATATPCPQEFARAFNSPRGQEMLFQRVTILHCTSEYPAPPESINLRAMATLAATFDLNVGLSDHSLGITVATAAVAMGATMIEKHFTLDRDLPGPDHKASMTPDELRSMIAAIRIVERALGSPDKRPVDAERSTRAVARKSLVALSPIAKGERFTEKNLGAKRPGRGRSPLEYWSYLGHRASRDYRADDMIAEPRGYPVCEKAS